MPNISEMNYLNSIESISNPVEMYLNVFTNSSTEGTSLEINYTTYSINDKCSTLKK